MEKVTSALARSAVDFGLLLTLRVIGEHFITFVYRYIFGNIYFFYFCVFFPPVNIFSPWEFGTLKGPHVFLVLEELVEQPRDNYKNIGDSFSNPLMID